jgi:hypothetical protein
MVSLPGDCRSWPGHVLWLPVADCRLLTDRGLQSDIQYSNGQRQLSVVFGRSPGWILTRHRNPSSGGLSPIARSTQEANWAARNLLATDQRKAQHLSDETSASK